MKKVVKKMVRALALCAAWLFTGGRACDIPGGGGDGRGGPIGVRRGKRDFSRQRADPASPI